MKSFLQLKNTYKVAQKEKTMELVQIYFKKFKTMQLFSNFLAFFLFLF